MPFIEAHTGSLDRGAGIFEQPECFFVAWKLDSDFFQEPFGMSFELVEAFLVQELIGRDVSFEETRSVDRRLRCPPRSTAGTATGSCWLR